MKSVRSGDGLDDPAENERLTASQPDTESAAAEIEHVAAPFSRKPSRTRMTPFIILVLALVALAVGWALATVFQSSAQRDAATAPPASSPILATVATGNLVRQTAFSGSVVAENEESLSVAVSPGALRSVITGRPVTQGAAVNTGQVFTEVNGRPVFVVQSAFPFYRDMGLGDRGPDVIAIQETLKYLGYSLDVDGEFGGQTEMAVRDWYFKNDYTPATRDVEEDSKSNPSGSEPRQEGPQLGTDSGAARATIAAFVPFSEILGVKILPSASLGALAVGTSVGADGETDIVLGSTKTKVTFEAAPADLTYIAQGSEVSIETDGPASKGSVSSIVPIESSSQEETTGGQTENDDAQSMSRVTVTPSEPIQASNAKVRVISSQIIVDQEALLVPTIAVVDRGDTNQVVIVSRSDGEFSEVEVTVLGVLDGKAAIVPLSPSSIQDGDRVRVGFS